MKSYAVVLTLLVGAHSFSPALTTRRNFGVITSRGESAITFVYQRLFGTVILARKLMTLCWDSLFLHWMLVFQRSFVESTVL